MNQALVAVHSVCNHVPTLVAYLFPSGWQTAGHLQYWKAYELIKVASLTIGTESFVLNGVDPLSFDECVNAVRCKPGTKSVQRLDGIVLFGEQHDPIHVKIPKDPAKHAPTREVEAQIAPLNCFLAGNDVNIWIAFKQNGLEGRF